MTKKVIAITSCAVGIAHTYMAAENLEKAGKEMGVDIKVETHGSIGIENKLTKQDIEEAEGLIIAADTEIERSRFGGKRIIAVGVQDGIRRPEELIQSTLDQKGKVQNIGGTTKASEDDDQGSDDGSVGNTLYRGLMNGVSYMVPFVVTGGLLIAIALSLGGQPTEAGFVIPEGTIWYHINNIGNAAMGFMVPILAGYIAYGIADRPGLVPGMVGGYIAANGSFYGSEANTGFIGGIIAGFIAGYVAKLIKKIKVPKAMETVMPIIFIPIISSLIVGLIFIYLIGAPVAQLFTALTSWLAGMQGASSVVLATIIGVMISVDMGGPFNKTAFLFGSGLIAEGEYSVMGAVAVAVSVPPIALGIASYVYRKKFSNADRQAGTASIAMGFFGITEGAIPFAAKDPLRVIPAIMGGSVVGSIIAMLGGVGGHVAHGGPIVAILGAVDNVLIYFIALIVGVIVSVVLIGFLKKDLDSELAFAEDVAAVESGKSEEELENQNDSENIVTYEEEAVESKNETAEDALSLVNLTSKELFNMDIKSDHKNDAFKELLSLPALEARISNKEAVLQGVLNREKEGSTGMGEGIAIPHAKSSEIKEATVVFGRSKEGIEWESLDGQPAYITFLILVPERQKGDLHLKILQILARKLMDENFKESLLKAETKDEVYDILKEVK